MYLALKYVLDQVKSRVAVLDGMTGEIFFEVNLSRYLKDVEEPAMQVIWKNNTVGRGNQQMEGSG
jgi:hypothetical protein